MEDVVEEWWGVVGDIGEGLVLEVMQVVEYNKVVQTGRVAVVWWAVVVEIVDDDIVIKSDAFSLNGGQNEFDYNKLL